MLRTILFATALFSFSSSSALACPMADAAAFEKAAEAVKEAKGAKASFKLKGLVSGSCSKKVSAELKTVEGIILSAIDYQSGRVEIAYNNKETNLKKIEDALVKSGFEIIEKPKA